MITAIELWCNGNTSDFGSEFPGSNPGSSTKGNVAQLVRASDC